jgi:hypothetical protein
LVSSSTVTTTSTKTVPTPAHSNPISVVVGGQRTSSGPFDPFRDHKGPLKIPTRRI